MKGELIFLGTGTSEGVPRVTCLTRDPVTCAVCTDAVRPGSKNRRRNVSLLVRYPHPDGRTRNVVIDAGKFFYHSAIEWFPKYAVRGIDAVVLTHAHADSAGGLDDLRDWTNNAHGDITVYLRPEDLDVVSKTHFYLVDRSKATSGGSIAKLRFHEIGLEPFDVEELTFTPLPVWHGRPFTALGFGFAGVRYLSDVSEIPEETARLTEGCDLLVVDALRPERTHGSHFTVEQAIEEVRRLKPRRALLTGMAHDVEHETWDLRLAALKKSEGLDVRLAYDGLRLEIDL